MTLGLLGGLLVVVLRDTNGVLRPFVSVPRLALQPTAERISEGRTLTSYGDPSLSLVDHDMVLQRMPASLANLQGLLGILARMDMWVPILVQLVADAEGSHGATLRVVADLDVTHLQIGSNEHYSVGRVGWISPWLRTLAEISHSDVQVTLLLHSLWLSTPTNLGLSFAQWLFFMGFWSPALTAVDRLGADISDMGEAADWISWSSLGPLATGLITTLFISATADIAGIFLRLFEAGNGRLRSSLAQYRAHGNVSLIQPGDIIHSQVNRRTGNALLVPPLQESTINSLSWSTRKQIAQLALECLTRGSSQYFRFYELVSPLVNTDGVVGFARTWPGLAEGITGLQNDLERQLQGDAGSLQVFGQSLDSLRQNAA